MYTITATYAQSTMPYGAVGRDEAVVGPEKLLALPDQLPAET